MSFDLANDGKINFLAVLTLTVCKAMKKKTARQFLEAIINKYKKQYNN
jgi:hypothetical protein